MSLLAMNRPPFSYWVAFSILGIKLGVIDPAWPLSPRPPEVKAWDSLTPIEETMRALDDLVAAGKVRYIGFSDTPAWKALEAQMIAKFRGWAPLIALQLEYSLLERTIEGELVPMALEHGLGVTPWSPLKSGALSGKYTKAQHEERLNVLTAPTLNFPYDFVNRGAARFSASGTTVNSVTGEVNPMTPTSESDRY